MAGIGRMQWQGDNAVDVADLLPDHNFHHKDGALIIHQHGGDIRIPHGGWFAIDAAGHAHRVADVSENKLAKRFKEKR